MKLIHTIPVFLGLLAATQVAPAQTASVYYGFGTATNSSSNQQIDTFGTGTPYTTPKMGGLFSDLGANFMFTKHFGVGGDLSWRDTSAAYAGLNYRPFFYNVDAVYDPVKTKHVEPELRLGLGGVNVRYSYSQQVCDQFTGCSTSNQFLESSHHFQTHAAAAVRLYATDHVFIRPAFDFHYVDNFFQFGHNWVPEYSVGVGYTFGSRE